MPTIGRPPFFHGKAVLVDFDAKVLGARLIHAGIHGLVRRMEDTHADEDELLMRVHELVVEHDGLVCRLVDRTPEAIEFAVSKR
jgi:hypothetical protein